MKVVGLIALPLDAGDFADIASAFDEAHRGCVMGESSEQHIKIGEVTFVARFAPILLDDDAA